MLSRYEPRRGDDRGKPVLTRSVPYVASVGAWKGLKMIFLSDIYVLLIDVVVDVCQNGHEFACPSFVAL